MPQVDSHDAELDDMLSFLDRKSQTTTTDVRWYKRLASFVSALFYATFHLITLGIFCKEELYPSHAYRHYHGKTNIVLRRRSQGCNYLQRNVLVTVFFYVLYMYYPK